MIKIRPKIFMITSLFCLGQHFPLMTSLIFNQNFGNYSFVCIYWTIYCFSIYYHLFENYWVALSKYQKIMASLPFLLLWRQHIFLMVIQVFTENIFPPIFELLIPWTWLATHFLAFWEIYILIIIWCPIGIPKHQMGLNVAEWCHMTYLSWNRRKTADVSK